VTSEAARQSPLLLLAAVIGVLLFPSVNVSAQEPEPVTVSPGDSALDAADWIRENHQNSDGGYSSFSQGADVAPSDMAGSLNVLLHLSASSSLGQGELGLKDELLVDYLIYHVDERRQFAEGGLGQAALALLALELAAIDELQERETLLAALLPQIETATDLGGPNPIDLSLAVAALQASGHESAPGLLTALLLQQSLEGDSAGAWPDGYGTLASVDATAFALIAVAPHQVSDQGPLSDGMAFLLDHQLSSGGWAYDGGSIENANSTAMALMALTALRDAIDPPSQALDASRRAGLDALHGWQSTSGAIQADFGQGRFDDFYATVQSLPALRELSLVASSEAPSMEADDLGLAVVMAILPDDVLQSCVDVGSPISALEGLEKVGSEVVVAQVAGGVAVCSVSGIGCPAADCFCECSGGQECNYWSLWSVADNSWQYAAVGAASFTVNSGDIVAWSWLPEEIETTEIPSVADVCANFDSIETAPLSVVAATSTDGSWLDDQVVWATIIGASLLLISLLLLARRRRSRAQQD